MTSRQSVFVSKHLQMQHCKTCPDWPVESVRDSKRLEIDHNALHQRVDKRHQGACHLASLLGSWRDLSVFQSHVHEEIGSFVCWKQALIADVQARQADTDGLS